MPAMIDNMAYVGETPWHGLGNSLTESATIDEWRTQAGLDWTANKSPVYFDGGDDDLFYMEDKNVLFRSDTKVPLGVVGNQFKIVQPAEVLEFFRDLTDLGHFTMDTAGSLFNGRRVWALARATTEGKLSNDDIIRPYLFMATGLDGTLATTASFTSIRIVCNNTLSIALKDKANDRIRVTHRGEFDAQAAKADLGLMDASFDSFMANADRLASIQVNDRQAKDYYGELFLGEKYTSLKDEEIQSLDSRTLDQLLETRLSFPGQDTTSAKGTAWGLVNGVTAYLDHVRNTQTVDARLNDVWFGKGKATKTRAVELALNL